MRAVPRLHLPAIQQKDISSVILAHIHPYFQHPLIAFSLPSPVPSLWDVIVLCWPRKSGHVSDGKFESLRSLDARGSRRVEGQPPGLVCDSRQLASSLPPGGHLCPERQPAFLFVINHVLTKNLCQ